MKEIATDVYQFPVQQFFAEPVRTYAIVQRDTVFCFDIPRDTEENVGFLKKFSKPIRMIMSHGSTANGFEATKNSLQEKGLDVEIWLGGQDNKNSWLSITPDVLFEDQKKKISEDLLLISTPGHTKGSVCLLINVGQGILLTGDTLGGTKEGDIRPFPLKTNDLAPKIFFESLRKLLTYSFDTMYPFHYYPITDAKTKLEQYITVYNPKGGDKL